MAALAERLAAALTPAIRRFGAALATFLTFLTGLLTIRAGFRALEAAFWALAFFAAVFRVEAFAARFAVRAAGFFFAAGFLAMDASPPDSLTP
jgi:hypothetical protein